MNEPVISPNAFVDGLAERARMHPQRIAFPESGCINVLKAAEQTVALGIGDPIFVGKREEIERTAEENGIWTEGFTYYDHSDTQWVTSFAARFATIDGTFSEKAIIRKMKNPLRCAMLLQKAGLADCVAAGKEYATGEVVYEAINILGLQEGVTSPSSVGIADIPGFTGGENGMLALADCAINPQPDAEDLAGIAIASADTVSKMLGWEPRIAMLSFSTCGSAEHESLAPIREAVQRIQAVRSDLKIDGELQLDSAILEETAKKKVNRESSVAGKANVLIFPNLHAGNIAVKSIQIFGKANAYGPILQGFAKPVCDFSRSAPVEEMLGNLAMLVNLAAEEN